MKGRDASPSRSLRSATHTIAGGVGIGHWDEREPAGQRRSCTRFGRVEPPHKMNIAWWQRRPAAMSDGVFSLRCTRLQKKSASQVDEAQDHRACDRPAPIHDVRETAAFCCQRNFKPGRSTRCLTGPRKKTASRDGTGLSASMTGPEKMIISDGFDAGQSREAGRLARSCTPCAIGARPDPGRQPAAADRAPPSARNGPWPRGRPVRSGKQSETMAVDGGVPLHRLRPTPIRPSKNCGNSRRQPAQAAV